MKSTFIKIIAVISITLLLPYVVTSIMTGNDERVHKINTEDIIIIISIDEKIEKVNLETYLIGVLAAQMPPDYELEALKAQGVIARTAIVKTIESLSSKEINSEELGQDYIGLSQMKELWGYDAYANYLPKLENAIYATKGEVILYENKPIEAVFHSISTGKTRDARDAWGYDIPYLVSVDSSADMESDEYMKISISTISEIIELLKENDQGNELIIKEENFFEELQIIERDNNGYIKTIQIGNKIYSGEKLRESLNLNSACIYIENHDGNVRLISKGSGHGVGMSRYGAGIMAKKGATYSDIIKYYYTGVEIK